jgi:hypothetical protein
MDALTRNFAATHDMKVKDEINLFAKEYGKLDEPWCSWRGERAGFTLGLCAI